MTPQGDVVSGVSADVLHAVMAGNDGCILCFGGPMLGKTYSMVGLCGEDGEHLGVMPSCVAWLYACIAHLKASSSTRSVLLELSGL